jgi:DNA-binding NarL/FixJ family response regulator
VRAQEIEILLVDDGSADVDLTLHLTSSKEERDLNAGYDLGVNSYIQKPVDFEQFRETVHALAPFWLVLNQAPPRQDMANHTEKSA